MANTYNNINAYEEVTHWTVEQFTHDEDTGAYIKTDEFEIIIDITTLPFNPDPWFLRRTVEKNAMFRMTHQDGRFRQWTLDWKLDRVHVLMPQKTPLVIPRFGKEQFGETYTTDSWGIGMIIPQFPFTRRPLPYDLYDDNELSHWNKAEIAGFDAMRDLYLVREHGINVAGQPYIWHQVTSHFLSELFGWFGCDLSSLRERIRNIEKKQQIKNERTSL